MSNRYHQLNVAHTLTAYFLLGYLYTTTVADNTLVTNSLVFTTVAFVILYRTENTLAKQTVPFGLVGPVIDLVSEPLRKILPEFAQATQGK